MSRTGVRETAVIAGTLPRRPVGGIIARMPAGEHRIVCTRIGPRLAAGPGLRRRARRGGAP